MLKYFLVALMAVVVATGSAHATIQTTTVNYVSGDDTMEGFVAYNDAVKSPRPGILIAHDWMGQGQFTKDKAIQLAKEGYVAFAVDVYGKGIRPADMEEAKSLSTKYKDDRPLLQAHMRAAYNALIGMKQVDSRKVIVMGYCFGGTAALELARSGAALAGTATFHGGLSNPTPDNAKNITGPVLIMHGADDPMVPASEVAAFKNEMEQAGVPFKFVSYPGAVHAFTNPYAGNDNSKGAAYNASADKASWIEFEKFLSRVAKISATKGNHNAQHKCRYRGRA